MTTQRTYDVTIHHTTGATTLFSRDFSLEEALESVKEAFDEERVEFITVNSGLRNWQFDYNNRWTLFE